MADRFEALARIPTRPLSYEYRDLAEDKELLVDYVNHMVYLHVDNEFYDITANITDIVNSVIQQLQENPTLLQNIFNTEEGATIIGDVNITLPNGDTVTISNALIAALTRIQELEKELGIVRDEFGNVVDTNKSKLEELEELLGITRDEFGNIIDSSKDKISELEELLGITRDEDGNLISAEIKAEDIKESEDKQFASQEEKDTWNGKASIFMINVIINPGANYWTATDGAEPYIQQIDVPEIKESDYPVVDVVLAEAYNAAMEQLNNYAYIYKILTYDGYIKVYATQMTEVALTIQMKVDR